MHRTMNFSKRSLISGFAAVLLLTFAGCTGYQLGPIKPTNLANTHSLAVPTFKNETLEPRIQSLATNAVIKQLQMDGSYTVAAQKKADATLNATIKTIERRQLRSVRTDVLRSSELEVTVAIEYSVVDNQTSAILSKGSINGRTNIFLEPNFQLSERQAVQDALERAATNLVTSISEGW
jgi:hypothetical protein